MPPKFSAPDNQQERNTKTTIYIFAVIFLFVVLAGRLLYLQYFQYDVNHRLSESNRIREIIVKAPRGSIYDRNGELLVRNRPSYQISILPYKIENSDSVFNKLMRINDENGETIFDSTHVKWTFERGKWRKFRPLRILEDASIEHVSIIEEHIDQLPGVVTIVESRRDYPYGTLAAHALGYTGEVTEEQLEKEKYKDYSYGDRLGKKGLERQYESYFKGTNGMKYAEVNAYGKEIGLIEEMPHIDAIPGSNIVTSLDLGLQKVAEDALADSLRGAIVAINPKTGEILAMVSSPRLDPNIFSLEKKELNKEWATVALDSAKPLHNRAVVGTYAPGSVFKFITAIAALKNNKIDLNTRYFCPGYLKFGSRIQKCWKHSGHGSMNVIGALRESCNVFFYNVGLSLGMDKINEVGRMYGLGEYTKVDLPIERRGLLVDSASFNKRNKRRGWRWSRGLILNLAIGQGELVTPLQVANAFGAIATNKGLFRPHLMKEIRDAKTNKIIEKYEPELLNEAHLDTSLHKYVIQAMEEVVSGVRGTGRRAGVKGIRVGGKSGSSQNPHGKKPHAWFAATAPLEDPEIAIAIVIENKGGGGANSAPIAAKMLKYYFYGEVEK